MQKLITLLLLAVLAFSCGGEATDAATEAETATEAGTEETTAAPDAMATVFNPNLVTAEELAALPQIDEALAQQIIDGRPYLDMQSFQAVLAGTLDESAQEALFTVLFVPLNLNTTPEDEFLLVPGVGEKMAHEFEEYRPYTKVAQFRREMGKYVDEDEIARYEKYVFVPVALNSATDEEILAIPGVGDRMLHEFKEYRPYNSMEQFRREIGKYVDDNELARLERFVYLDTEDES
jgi:DNA uptake protein ComE-like DNA-binding protein